VNGGPVETILGRLDGVRRSGRGWTALCPAHEDKHASLSVAVGDDGRALLHDHAGCSVDDVVATLGLELADLFLPSEDFAEVPEKSSGLSHKPYRFRRRAPETLLKRPALLLEVAVAKDLARLSEADARVAVLRAWDALTKRLDIVFVLQLAGIIRGVALLCFGSARELTPRWSEELGEYVQSHGLDRAVSRMLRRVA
jgi:hypothetical protein